MPRHKDNRPEVPQKAKDAGLVEHWRKLFQEDRTSHKAFFESFRIQVKEALRLSDGKLSSLVPLKLNKAQEGLIDDTLQAWADGHGASIVYDKGRQDGLTTIVQIFLGERALRAGGGYGVAVSRKLDQNQVAFRILRDFGRQIPEWAYWHALEGHIVSRNTTAFEIEFDNGSRSLIRCVTCKDASLGHGDQNRWMSIDEYARWPSNKDDLDEAWPSWLDSPGNWRFVFSTAKGKEQFCKMFRDAEQGLGGWKARFSSWLVNPYKTKKFASAEAKATFIQTIGKLPQYGTDDELTLIAMHRATPEQLHWRRNAIDGNHRGDILAFKRTNPTTPEESFLAAESQFFSLTALEMHSLAGMEMEKRALRGRLSMPDSWNARGVFETDAEVRVLKSDHVWGPWRIFEAPQAGVAYTWGADPAEGKAQLAEGSKEPDYATIEVREVLSKRIVAQYRDRIDPQRFALEIIKCATFYGACPGYVEENNMGQVVIDRIEEMYERGDLLLTRRRIVKTDRGKKVTFATGFKANRPNRHATAVRLKEWMEGLSRPADVSMGELPYALIDEMQHCQQDEDGWFTGAEIGHDDMVTAARLACEACVVLEKEPHRQTQVPQQMKPHEKAFLMGAALVQTVSGETVHDRDLPGF